MGKAKIFLVLVVGFLTFISGIAYAGDWESSPYNLDNSQYNWQNSPYNWSNSPYNRKNSPYRRNNDRVIRDNSGKPLGYAVPKSDGGVNYYDYEGNRTGYSPAD